MLLLQPTLAKCQLRSALCAPRVLGKACSAIRAHERVRARCDKAGESSGVARRRRGVRARESGSFCIARRQCTQQTGSGGFGMHEKAGAALGTTT